MRIDSQGHFFTIYFPGFVCFVLYLAKIAGERLQDHWSSGLDFSRPPLKYDLFVLDVVMEDQSSAEQVSMNVVEEMETGDEAKKDAKPATEQKVNGEAAEDEFTVDIKVEKKREYYIHTTLLSQISQYEHAPWSSG